MNTIKKTDSGYRILSWFIYVGKNVHLNKNIKTQSYEKKQKNRNVQKKAK